MLSSSKTTNLFHFSLSLSYPHPSLLPVSEMPVLVAASVSGGFAFLSNFSISTDNASQNALPPTSISFSNCWTKRPALLIPAKVSLSSGSSTQTDDGVDQSSFTDDFKQARVCVFLNFSSSTLTLIILLYIANVLCDWELCFINWGAWLRRKGVIIALFNCCMMRFGGCGLGSSLARKAGLCPVLFHRNVIL